MSDRWRGIGGSVLLIVAGLVMACQGQSTRQGGGDTPLPRAAREPAPSRQEPAPEEPHFREARSAMVTGQLEGRDIHDRRVLKAMGRVRRQLFLPSPNRGQAYGDSPLPIGEGQTISQPYVVAFMSQVLGLTGRERVLEVGTGSGYQAAILAELSREVYSIEIIESLSRRAGNVLSALGYDNVQLRVGDGYRGWPERAPFQAIMVTAACPHVPPALKEQLADGGKMVLPVGQRRQDLVLIERTGQAFAESRILPVRFVPLLRGGSAPTTGGE